ncbi:hypothetical protein Moror_872 [Moniliophthora roreri MCA 2997]|uniref:Uncharacterized protein n=2 Tax=Moniliophthora roreri TaxID=221103 RepID=V2YDP9_MONRO|nr:hypothetical protein Moror_872 [Moniliophthora roreri MCA 2997]KAI3606402.1 hypothetical protein WG66_009527 [Moniliophthora roreri]
MADTTQVNTISVIAVLVECIFYGILSMLFAITLFAVSQKRITMQLIRVHAVGVVMFILATVHISVNIHHITNTFANSDNGVSLVPSSGTVFLLKEAILILQIVLSDGFWLYRLHVVWSGNKRVTLPFATTFLANVALGIYTIVLFRSNSLPSYSPEVRSIGGATLILGFVTNFGCTSLIASGLYYTGHRVRFMRSTGGHNVISMFMLLVIESGAIYSAFLLTFLVSLALGSGVSFIPFELIGAVVGIVFYMLMLPTTLGYRSTNEHSGTALSGKPTISLRRTSISQQDVNLSPPPDALNLRPMVVHVTKWGSQTKESDISI